MVELDMPATPAAEPATEPLQGMANEGFRRPTAEGKMWINSPLQPRVDLHIESADAHAWSPSVGVTEPRWIVFDPISRQSHRIGWIEHWLLTRVDGHRAPADLVKAFRQETPGSRVRDTQLLQLLERFELSQLVCASRKQGESIPQIWQRHVSGLVFYQFRGIQPDRWLSRLAPHSNLLFSFDAVRFWLLATGLTLCCVLLEFRRLADQVVAWQDLLRPSIVGMLLVVFLVTRGLHEMGHALVCKRFGIRCPDIGIFLILGAPCVYCDVSESWKLKQRWQRAAVAAAGMYVELILATVAAWIWMLTVDGPVNTLALHTMFVCSASTLLINANPLMRFDGYYILADWLDEANLRGKADTLALALLTRIVLGMRATEVGTPRGRKYFLTSFSLAGWVYRGMLSITIATVLVAIYANWNLVWLGRLFAGLILVSWWGVPTVRLIHNLFRQARDFVARLRVSLLAAGLVLMVTLVPLPHRRFATGWVQPRDTQGLYAGTTARLIECDVADGELVADGQPLFLLHQSVLLQETILREGDVARARIRRRSQQWQRDMYDQDPDLSQFERDLTNAERLAANAVQQLESLAIKAPISGRFSLADSLCGLEASAGQPACGSLWDPDQQLGRTIPQGTLLGTVCSDASIAVIPLAEAQLSDIARGSEVRVRVPQADYAVVTARVKSIVQMERLSDLWQAGGDPSRGSLPATPTHPFAAVVELPAELTAWPGSKVDAVFVAPSATLASLSIGWLKSNLRLLAD